MFDAIDTPSVLIDLDVAEANIRKFQAYCDTHAIALRPHVKTHKLPSLARYQIEQGAVGITCQKISEAQAMIAAVPKPSSVKRIIFARQTCFCADFGSETIASSR